MTGCLDGRADGAVPVRPATERLGAQGEDGAPEESALVSLLGDPSGQKLDGALFVVLEMAELPVQDEKQGAGAGALLQEQPLGVAPDPVRTPGSNLLPPPNSDFPVAAAACSEAVGPGPDFVDRRRTALEALAVQAGRGNQAAPISPRAAAAILSTLGNARASSRRAKGSVSSRQTLANRGRRPASRATAATSPESPHSR